MSTSLHKHIILSAMVTAVWFPDFLIKRSCQCKFMYVECGCNMQDNGNIALP